jgi:hypothetical protein
MILLLFLINACVVIPIPRDSYPEGTRENITPDLLASFEPGRTTKAEVLQKLGEPDVVSEDGSRFAYLWIKIKATILWAVGAGYSGGAGITDLKRQYVFSVIFDDEGLVLEKGTLERRIFFGVPPSPGQRPGEWLVRRIDNYQVFFQKDDLEKKFEGRQVNVKSFTSAIPGQSEFFCPTGLLIMTPGDESFAGYIRKALISELSQVGGFSVYGNPSLSGRLNKIEYSFFLKPADTGPGYVGTMDSVVKEGCLNFSLTINSSNGKSSHVEEKHVTPCVASLSEIHRECECLTKEFMLAIQSLIGNLIRSPEFPALIKPMDADQGK